MSSIRAVVFDLDGLMFNTEELYVEVGNRLLEPHGYQLTDELLDKMMGRPGRVALQLMIDHHALPATVADLEMETDRIFPDVLDNRLAPMAGLLDLLELIESAGLPKAVATSSRRAFVVDVLRRFELEPRFQFLLTAEDVTQGKPHPEIYLRAAERLAVTPAQMMVLEDSENGCRAAVDAGAFVVAVPGAHSRRHCFDGAALHVDSLEDARIRAALAVGSA